MKTISITISGRVQGVFFRQSTKEKASELGVSGTVRNLSNGDVQVIATGSKDQLDELISWCHTGPSRAEVSKLVVEELLPENFDGFRIIR